MQPPQAVVKVIEHRGPDGEGWREFAAPAGRVILAHRRLAIIDTSSAGNQPMSFGDGRYWIVYNGEIYNYLELRTMLESVGITFRTRTDTEVLLAAYAQWGGDCLHRLNGMFAFAIWDEQEKILFAARDRFGIKPLYLYRTRDGFGLASEIKQFACLPEFTPRLNSARAYDFLTSGITDHSAETLFEGVRQIRGGEYLRTVVRDDRLSDPEIRRWYSLPDEPEADLTKAQAADRLRELLTESVGLRLRADVPIGSCLSGGLDSSSIVCLINEALEVKESTDIQTTISACYDDSPVDERHYIDMVLSATGVTNLKVFPQHLGVFQGLDNLAYHLDEPFGSTSIFAQSEVFRAARNNGIKVMLDGQGADEQLAGYHSMYGAFHASLFKGLRWRRMLRELKHQRRRHGVSWKAQVLGLLEAGYPETLISLYRRTGRSVLPSWLRGEAWAGDNMPALPKHAAAAAAGLRPPSTLARLCRADLLCTGLPKLLRYEDRNSMAHGVEARLPFLDFRLVEFLDGLGERFKIEDGETKRLLREAMRGVLPEKIRTRSDKIGFATPEADWIRGPLRDDALSAVENAVTRFPVLFDSAAMSKHVSDMIAGRKAFDFSLWRIVSLEAWGRVFRVTV
jgi:asparagine synthase (glutamine-hydrolysing)